MDRLFRRLQKRSLEVDELVEILNTVPNPDANQENRKGESILHLVIALNDEELLRSLLRTVPKTDVKRPDKSSRWPPLTFALISSSDIPILRLLLDHGADAAQTDSVSGFSAFHWAAKLNNVKALSLLLASPLRSTENLPGGGLLDLATQAAKSTPLHVACLAGSEESAAFLIEAGADVNKKNAEGQTPLHLAIQQNLPNLAARILESPNFERRGCADKAGNTPLHYARRHGLSGLCKLLQHHGFSASEVNLEGVSPDDILREQTAVAEEEGKQKTQSRHQKILQKELEKEKHKQGTEVTQFCESCALDDLIPLFYSKKILFVDDYFLNLDETKLKKMGLTEPQRRKLFDAFEARKRRLAEEEKRQEREALAVMTAMKRRRQIISIVGVVLLFVLLYTILHLVERGVIRVPSALFAWVHHQQSSLIPGLHEL